MPDHNPSLPRVPESKAVPKKRTRLSMVWLIPLVAAAAGVWIAVTKILNEGPTITIVFQSGEGLEAGKTKIEYNGLEVGKLTDIQLTKDRQHVIATAKMVPKSEPYLVKDTKFWIVKPRISGLNITGLGTLISGYYVGVELGQSRESERHFVALETPPPIAANTPGRFFMLKTPVLGSLNEGTPIFFRKLQAGQVVSYELDKSGQFLDVKIFVHAPYDQYVNPNTRFWQASGIDMSLSAAGLHVQTESVMSILAGGIAFETPATDSPLPPADAGTTFTLYDNRADAFKPPPQDPQTYLLVFKQSVRGLIVGAPVQMGGITIGEVTQISPQFDVKTGQFTVPVTVSIDPKRYGVKFLNAPTGPDLAAVREKSMNILVAHGLRAHLKTGSLISGSLYVALDFDRNAPPATLDWSRHPVQLPTRSANIEELADNITGLLKNLDQTVTNVDKLLGNANQLIVPGSELNNLLLQGNDAARSIRLLADYLERHPEALIRGKTGKAK